MFGINFYSQLLRIFSLYLNSNIVAKADDGRRIFKTNAATSETLPRSRSKAKIFQIIQYGVWNVVSITIVSFAFTNCNTGINQWLEHDCKTMTQTKSDQKKISQHDYAKIIYLVIDCIIRNDVNYVGWRHFVFWYGLTLVHNTSEQRKKLPRDFTEPYCRYVM